MDTPQYAVKQYISSASFTANAATVTGGINEEVLSMFGNGILNAEATMISLSGLVATIVFSPAFAFITATGQMCHAHGVTTNADSQTYNIDLTSNVPVSGSQLVYIYLTPHQIQMSPFSVIGPPKGHQDYDPYFVPYTAYAFQRDSFSMAAGTSIPAGSVEFARTTLTAGQTSGVVLDQSHIYRASGYLGKRGEVVPADLSFNVPLYKAEYVTANYNVTAADIGSYIFLETVSNKVVTLPNANTMSNSVIGFLQVAGGGSSTVINTSAGDSFVGGVINGGTSATLNEGDFLVLFCDGGEWEVISGSLAILGGITESSWTGNLATTGWRKSPDGFIEQWGTGGTNTAGYGIANFPIPFPTACFHVMGNAVSGPGGTGPGDGVQTESTLSLATHNFYSYRGSGYIGPISFNWRAIGK